MCITIRKFAKEDIPKKIDWINNPLNNQFLHYDLPLEYEKTCEWFDRVKDRKDRYDAVIEMEGKPVGLIGLLSIDYKNKKAEFYVSMGEPEYKGKGVATKASLLLLKYAFINLKLEKIYLYTETENIVAQHLFQKIGFKKEGILKKDLFSRGNYVDRLIYGFTKEEYLQKQEATPIQALGKVDGNLLYIKREDMIPYSFGGNKARKAMLFFREIDQGGYDCVVTYGSSSSNHCRVVSNLCAARELPCYIVSPLETDEHTFNKVMMELFGAELTAVPVEEVHDTIEGKLRKLREDGKKPYFIAGGGHGNLGTQAYVNCYREILEYEKESGIHFDYIFHASGTGTTQAGLVCGQLMNHDERAIIGISIARRNPRGRDVVIESIHDYMAEYGYTVSEVEIQNRTKFIDDYISSGYGKDNPDIEDTIKTTMIQYGIPLDSTYTGKAFWGMKQIIHKENIHGSNVLFIHTGGIPLFFDDIKRL